MKKSDELERMGKNIVDGMEAAGIKRFVYCASAGVDGEIPGIAGKVIMKILTNPLKDHRAALDYYKSKKFTYSTARPMGLKDEPLSTSYSESLDSVSGTSRSIARASVAHFMLKALTDATYENTSVGLSK